MKKSMLIIFLLTQVVLGQDPIQYSAGSTFEDGTLNNWSNANGTTNGLTNLTFNNVPNGDVGLRYLNKTNSDSSEELSIKTTQWTGNTFYNPEWGTPVEFYVKNDNNFDLHLRLAFKGSNNSRIVSNANIVSASTDWQKISFNIEVQNLHLLDTGNPYTVNNVLSDIVELKIIHNQNIAYEGTLTTGNLNIDHFGLVQLLSVGEFKSKIATSYPNPIKNQLTLNFTTPNLHKDITIYSSLGQVLFQQKNTQNQELQIDATTFPSGIYFLEIIAGKSKEIQKLIKN